MCKKLFALNVQLKDLNYMYISYLLKNFVLIKMIDLIKFQLKLSNSKKKEKNKCNIRELNKFSKI